MIWGRSEECRRLETQLLPRHTDEGKGLTVIQGCSTMAPRHVIIVLFRLRLRRPYKVLDLSLHYSIIMHLTMLVKKGAIRCSTVLTPTATYPSDTSAVYGTAPSPLLSHLDFLSVMTAVSLALSVTSHVFSSHFEQGFFFCVCNFDAYLYAGQPAPFFAHFCANDSGAKFVGVFAPACHLGFFVATVHSLRNWPRVLNGEWENSFGRGTSCGYPTTGIRRLNIWSLTEFLSRFIIYGDEKRFLLMKWVVLGWPPQASQDQVALPSSQPRLFLAPGACLIREERRL